MSHLSLSTTAKTPITLGAVHALLTQWRQTHSVKARIPYILILEIASLIGYVPIRDIKQTLGISHEQLSYFESVYRASCITRVSPPLNQQSTLSVGTCAESVPITPYVDVPHVDAESSQISHNPRFIKASYAPDSFSADQTKLTPSPPVSLEFQPPLTTEHVTTPLLPDEQNVTPQDTLQEASHPLSAVMPAQPVLSSIHAHTPPHTSDDAKDPVRIPITLANQSGITFTATLSEHTALMFMHTFSQRS